MTSTSAWHSIETAPKDGTEILLRSAKGRIANGLWSAASERSGFWAWAYVNQEPVEWMPLPPAQAQDVRQPLTDEQIEALPVWSHFVGLWPDSRKEIVRAIEAAHAIAAQQGGA